MTPIYNVDVKLLTFTLVLTFAYAQKGCEIKLKINDFQGKTLLIAYHFSDVLSLPRIFLLDENRRIRAKYISPSQLSELLIGNFIRSFGDAIWFKGG